MLADECQIAMFPTDDVGDYVGSYVIPLLNTDGIDQYFEQPLWDHIIRVDINDVSLNGAGYDLTYTSVRRLELEVRERYTTPSMLTANSLADMVSACLLPNHTRLEDCLLIAENLVIHKTPRDRFGSCLLVKLADEVFRILDNTPGNLDNCESQWETPMQHVIHELLIARKQHKNVDEVESLVSHVVMKYLKLGTKEGSKCILNHKQTKYAFMKTAQKLSDKMTVSDITYLIQGDPEDSFCSLAMVLGHLGRTTELTAFLTSTDCKSILSYLLYATGLLKRGVKGGLGDGKPYDQAEDLERLSKCAEEYETLAKEIVHSLYVQDKGLSREILLTSIPENMGHTVLQLASMATARSFLSDKACKQALYDRWWGKYCDTKWHKLFVFLILPCLQKHPTCRCRCQKDMCRSVGAIYQVPAIKCLINYFAYIAFMTSFSIFVLTGPTKDISILEYILLAWVVILFIEEARQFNRHRKIRQKDLSKRVLFSNYMRDFWNVLDLSLVILYFIGFSLRLGAHFVTDKSMECKLLNVAQVIFAMDVFVIYIRSLQFYAMHEQIGPLIIMARRMCVDLTYFMFLLLIVLTGYGVALHSVLYPGTKLSESLLNSIIQVSYMQIYGDLELDRIMAAPAEADIHDPPETDPDVRNYFGLFLSGSYLLLTHILLLNLLIAMFNSSYVDVKEDTEYHHVLHMNDLLIEYSEKSAVPPPFVILTYIPEFVWGCWGRFKRTDSVQQRGRENQADNTDERIRKRENQIRQIVKKSVENHKNKTEKTIENQLNDISQAMEHQEHNTINDVRVCMESMQAVQEKMASDIQAAQMRLASDIRSEFRSDLSKINAEIGLIKEMINSERQMEHL